MNLDLKAMSALRPWACTLEVMRAAWEGAGFASQHGVDAHFYQRAEAERKQIYELEDSRTVAALLGSLTLEQQDEYLAQVLDELHLVPGRIETLINAWRRDDVAAIDVLQSQLPRLVHDRLFVQRNIWWTQSIIKGVREAPDAFVLVGCGHLVGKDNLIELLGAEGIEFKREVGV